ncbi:MAG: CotH kinase family protein [Cyclobacteriaceae bacterium]|nr:CotH kinase family protein [Cyclobacteriaceae bacterium]MCH8516489.1 CotH kinase family protein [Cyclobacteriaceae bacterium]
MRDTNIYLTTVLLIFTSHLVFSQPTPSHPSGFYKDSFDLTFENAEGYEIYYTLNGDNPKDSGILYTDPILLIDRTEEPNDYSMIRTNNISSGIRAFRSPRVNIQKINNLRWFYILDNDSSATINGNYFIGHPSNPFDLPVISISTNRENFWDEQTGIYVPGNTFTGSDASGNYYQTGREWEREIQLEIFEKDGTLALSQNAGARIHGGFSRRFAMKSLRLYARGDYGSSRFFYEMFPDQPEYQSYNRLTLRNSGNDFWHTQYRDHLMQGLIRHMNFDTQAGRSFIVFINGEYWGIQNMRERYDKHYLERKYGVPEEKLDLLTRGNGQVKEGDNSHFLAMLDFIQNNDLSIQENYQHVQTLMDTGNYIDYLIAQIYNGNIDWPGNNIDYWRYNRKEFRQEEGQLDGRWRWLLYDIDFTFGFSSSTEVNMLSRLNRSNQSTLIFRGLIENEIFKNDFIARVFLHLNTTYKTDRIVAAVDSAVNFYTSSIPSHIERWRISDGRYENQVDIMRTFAETRTNRVKSHFKAAYGLEEENELHIKYKQEEGVLTLSGTDLSSLPLQSASFEASFPSNLNIQLVASGKFGYRFLGWEDQDGELIKNDTLNIQLSFDQSYEAKFEFDLAGSDIDRLRVADENYYFNFWNDEAQAGSFPEYMKFYSMGSADPGLEAQIESETFGAYNLTSRSRINGLKEGGISFINTGNEAGNTGFPGTRLGAAGIALDLSDLDTAYLSWEGATLEPNSRIYNMRLRYRTSPDSDLKDLLDQSGNPIEYRRSEIAQERKLFENILLPQDIIGLPYVELIWQYYFTGERLDEDSGQRTMIRLGHIKIGKEKQKLSNDIDAHPLLDTLFTFDDWSSEAAYASYPNNMYFVYMDEMDPSIDAKIAGQTYGKFDLEERTRINGLGQDGFSFINTGNSDGNLGYPGNRLGGAILILNTEGIAGAHLKWSASSIEKNNRIYNIRLRYIDTDDIIRDIIGDDGDPIEFDPRESDQKSFELAIPTELLDQDEIKLFWQYFFTGERSDESGGARSMLAINQIRIAQTSIISPDAIFPLGEVMTSDFENIFEWEDLDESTDAYRLQIGLDEDFDQIIEEKEVDSKSAEIDYEFQIETPYFWRVKSVSQKSRTWSETSHFILQTPLSITQANDLRIFPNPFDNSITIEWKGSTQSDKTVEIINLKGKVIKAYQMQGGATQMNLEDLNIPKGIYILHLSDGDQSIKKKIIKQ